jgi:hypothetical protein
MKKQLFERLVESMEQHNEIVRGSRVAPGEGTAACNSEGSEERHEGTRALE